MKKKYLNNYEFQSKHLEKKKWKDGERRELILKIAFVSNVQTAKLEAYFS
jgi:hypothetical protein